MVKIYNDKNLKELLLEYNNSKKNPFKKCGIYIIKNIQNENVYIGQSVNIWARWQVHEKAYQNKNAVNYKCTLYKAIRKYGIENFIPNILEICEQNKLDEREIYWISKYDSCSNGYNETLGGDHGVKVDRDELLKLYNEKTHDINFLTEHFGCKKATIFAILRDNEIINDRYIQEYEEKEICDYYLKYAPNMKKMKKHFNRDCSVISKILKRNNIDIISGNDELVLVYDKNGDFLYSIQLKILRQKIESEGKSSNNIRSVMNSNIESKRKTTQGLIIRYHIQNYPKKINLSDPKCYWGKEE
jgi:group I intron endonuclease